MSGTPEQPLASPPSLSNLGAFGGFGSFAPLMPLIPGANDSAAAADEGAFDLSGYSKVSALAIQFSFVYITSSDLCAIFCLVLCFAGQLSCEE